MTLWILLGVSLAFNIWLMWSGVYRPQKFRKKVEPKSETLLLLEEQNEWSKQLTKYNQARENTRIQEHRLWNDEYAASCIHFEQFERFTPVRFPPQQVRFDK